MTDHRAIVEQLRELNTEIQDCGGMWLDYQASAIVNALPSLLTYVEKLEAVAADAMLNMRDESGRCLFCGTDDDDHYGHCSIAALAALEVENG